MLRRIAVPLDGSKLAERALPMALEIASRTGAGLRLITVHVPLSLRYGDPVLIPGDPLDSDVEKHEREYLEGLAESQSKVGGVEVGAVVVPMRYSIPGTIAKWAKAQGADGIAISKHGELGPGVPWLGSVADGLLRTSNLPILLVSSPQSPSDTDAFKVTDLVVPLDGSGLAEKALGLAAPLARKLGVGVTLLRVIPKYAEPGMTELRKLAREYLDSVKNRTAKAVPGASTEIKVSNHPAKAIVEFASSYPGRLVVMTTRGRGGLRRLLLGSVADKVARGSERPILLMQPPAAKKKSRRPRR
ncbi:MAG TPA: universal stress protein [Thermoplasmata archaeon]|nr:universal stress protein [Thermoplasmata archaeon]